MERSSILFFRRDEALRYGPRPLPTAPAMFSHALMPRLAMVAVLVCSIGCGGTTAAVGSSQSCSASEKAQLRDNGVLTFPSIGGSAVSLNYSASPPPAGQYLATLGSIACASLVPKPQGINASTVFAFTVATSGSVSVILSDLHVSGPFVSSAPYGLEIFDAAGGSAPIEEIFLQSNGTSISTVGSFGFGFSRNHSYVFEVVENADIDQLPPPPVPPSSSPSSPKIVAICEYEQGVPLS